MEIKRIVAPDVRTALRLVREQLGADAMIVSNRRVADGVEILAAPDGHTYREAPAGRAAAPVARAVPVPAEPSSPQFSDVQSELRSMRSFLEARLAEMRSDRVQYGPGVEGRAWRRLTRLGLPNGLVRDLVSGMDADAGWARAWASLASGLAASISERGDAISEGGVFALVGPTGAGKSTTLCKLAVRHALQHGASGLVLLSMDGMRLGGCDMLRAVARLLDVPFHAALEGESLAQMLERARGASLVLIDTAGLNRRNTQQAAQLSELGELRAGIETLLVLPSNAQFSWLESAVADYRVARPAAAVVTKLDETRSLGEILGLLVAERLALAYMTDGQEIPDDLSIGSASTLLERALALDPEPDAHAPQAPQGSGAAAGGVGARIAR